MTLDKFVKEINDELSQDCQIPFKVPVKSLMRTINWAKKWFWKHYEPAVEETFIVIERNEFDKASYTKDRKICLGDKIISVFEVYRMNGTGLLGDMSIDRLNQQEIYRYNNTGTLGGSDIEYYVARRISFDWMNQLLSHKISFDFNYLTHELNISGETPQGAVALHCYRSIADEYLYEDEVFYRYCVAQAKINLGRIIGTIKMPMVGNAEIDYDSLKQEGKDEIEQIKEDIEKENGADYFFEN